MLTVSQNTALYKGEWSQTPTDVITFEFKIARIDFFIEIQYRNEKYSFVDRAKIGMGCRCRGWGSVGINIVVVVSNDKAYKIWSTVRCTMIPTKY